MRPVSGWLTLLLVLPLLLAGCSNTIRGVQTYQYQGGDLRNNAIVYDPLADTAQATSQVSAPSPVSDDQGVFPPAGGPYSPIWQQCGVYSSPIYTEYALHSLARGAVWITYRPDLSADEVGRLRDVVAAQPYALLSPFAGQQRAVVVSAWNVQLSVAQAHDKRIERFIKKYAQLATVPEAGLPCVGGYTQGIDTQLP